MCTPARTIRFFEEMSPDHWELCGWDLEVLERRTDSNFVIFASSDLPRFDQYRSHFPKEFWSVVDADIAGSFYCHYSCADSKTRPDVSWASFKVKLVYEAGTYAWQQPTFFVKRSSGTGRQIVWLIDFLPLDQQSAFLKNLPKRSDRDRNLFLWHTVFAQEILEKFDTSFWLSRDLVRNFEKSAPPGIHQPSGFRTIHDIVRHVIHINETLESAEHTIQCMVDEQIRWRTEDPTTVVEIRELWLDAQSRLLALLKGIHSLKTRSKSLEGRLNNEISLAYNLVSQALGRDARSDSGMMKALGIVGLVYLPGTFVSGIFGTNFFSFQGGSSDSLKGDWTVSSDFWLYWAVTVSLTLGTVLVWVLWHFRAYMMRTWGVIWNWCWRWHWPSSGSSPSPSPLAPGPGPGPGPLSLSLSLPGLGNQIGARRVSAVFVGGEPFEPVRNRELEHVYTELQA
ncbi:hypothetical protein ASPCAL01080 [Aspergillus calidoustus]|uniref:Uncharacterized protein n=1 Tax=Aspergillus calidoustus TaxID=454130 RepID=A0A0U5C267_ASPCI|nr:hypothetical protein ASPCAL01080 [Aspergillus calidoustus]